VGGFTFSGTVVHCGVGVQTVVNKTLRRNMMRLWDTFFSDCEIEGLCILMCYPFVWEYAECGQVCL
jgi:hypothetical protein